MQNVVSDSFDVTTLLGSKLGLSLLLPLDMDSHAEYTLNHLFNVFRNEPLNGETPKLKYFGVGIRGCYNADDNTMNRVFSQDGYTEVTCVVSDLKGAWNVVPDTRDPQLEIGVSMEMKWTHSTTTNVLLD